MRAMVVNQTGGPEVLESQDVVDPKPQAGELLVRTHAVGVNFIETYQRSGVYPMELPFTPGGEASGTVIAVGEGVTGFAVDDRVTTAEAKATYAEQFVVEAGKAVVVPEGVSLDTAAAIPLQGLTAHYLAHSSAKPVEGDTVLVHAGAGGVGLLLTQILTNRGVTVITTASTKEKRQLSLNAGASHAIDYENFSDKVRELTNGEGVAVAYDGVGKTTFDGSLDALQIRGTLVLFGGASGQVPPFDLQRLNGAGSVSVTRPSIGHFLRTPEERALRYADLFDDLMSGRLDFAIGEKFALTAAADAHRALESRETTGKVILQA